MSSPRYSSRRLLILVIAILSPLVLCVCSLFAVNPIDGSALEKLVAKTMLLAHSATVRQANESATKEEGKRVEASARPSLEDKVKFISEQPKTATNSTAMLNTTNSTGLDGGLPKEKAQLRPEQEVETLNKRAETVTSGGPSTGRLKAVSKLLNTTNSTNSTGLNGGLPKEKAQLRPEERVQTLNQRSGTVTSGGPSTGWLKAAPKLLNTSNSTGLNGGLPKEKAQLRLEEEVQTLDKRSGTVTSGGPSTGRLKAASKLLNEQRGKATNSGEKLGTMSNTTGLTGGLPKKKAKLSFEERVQKINKRMGTVTSGGTATNHHDVNDLHDWARNMDVDDSATEGSGHAKSSIHVNRNMNVYSLMRTAWSRTDRTYQPRHDVTPCNEAAYWKFHLHSCCPREKEHFVRVNFTTQMLMYKWKNKKVAMIGDSITQQLIDSFLNNARADNITGVTLWKDSYPHLATLYTYNTALSRFTMGGISPVGNKKMEITYPAGPKIFEEAVLKSDVVYVNFGLHLDHLTMNECEELFQYTRRVLEEDMMRNPAKRHFFRTTLPQHFMGSNDRGTDYRKRLNNTCVKFGVDTAEHWTSSLAKKVFYNSSVRVLDYSDFLAHRGDLHSLYHRDDCSHWCWDYEMSRGILYLMYLAFE